MKTLLKGVRWFLADDRWQVPLATVSAIATAVMMAGEWYATAYVCFLPLLVLAILQMR